MPALAVVPAVIVAVLSSGRQVGHGMSDALGANLAPKPAFPCRAVPDMWATPDRSMPATVPSSPRASWSALVIGPWQSESRRSEPCPKGRDAHTDRHDGGLFLEFLFLLGAGSCQFLFPFASVAFRTFGSMFFHMKSNFFDSSMHMCAGTAVERHREPRVFAGFAVTPLHGGQFPQTVAQVLVGLGGLVRRNSRGFLQAGFDGRDGLTDCGL